VLWLSANGLLLAGLLLLGGQGGVKVKAAVAGVLIDRAFAAHLEDGLPHKPWPWADMHPIAQLEVPRHDVRRLVLSGASGSSMAFGPGHIDGTSSPDGPGNCVLAGHRDSWFAFLRHLERGDEILLQAPSMNRRYMVEGTLVTSMMDGSILEPTECPQLTLVTCWPFLSLRSSELRYVVICSLVRQWPGTLQSPQVAGIESSESWSLSVD
jgi:sortase A